MASKSRFIRLRGLTKQIQFASTTIYPNGSPVHSPVCVDRVDWGAGSSIVVALVGRQSVAGANPITRPSVLWFAAIQGIEGKQDPAGLAPKGCFISAKPVERVVGQIGQTQKATCELGGGINGFRSRAAPGVRSVCDAVRCSIGVGLDKISLPKPCIDNFRRLWLSLAALFELTQMVSLDFEQTSFHCRGAPQSPQ